MNKIIIWLLLLCCINVMAQPILEETTLNLNGSSNIFTASSNGFTTGGVGANVTWNYSSLILTPNGTSLSAVVTTSPFTSNFPQTNLIVKTTTNGTDFYSYYKKNSTKLETLGLATNSALLVNFSPNPQTLFAFPFTYNLTINDTYSTTNDPTADDPFSIKYDAYGTLITPFGTYNNVFRTKKLDGTFPEFSWYTLNPTLVVLNVKFGATGVNSVLFYQQTNLNVTTNYLKLNTTIVPNPVTDTFIVAVNNSFQDNFNYTILDLSGRIVMQNKTQFNVEINIENLEKGTYIIKINSENGIVAQHKIIKN